jgi:thiol-disulfide isomerase/thioredoxin
MSLKNLQPLYGEQRPVIDLRFATKKWIQSLMLISMLGASCYAAADNFKPFTESSFREIIKQYEGQEFLLGLWSIDCPPCMVELQYMADLLELNPEIPYVLISTDSIQRRDYSAEYLQDVGLSDRESWMFADSFVERLRFSIDPNWYGELPRSYFFDKTHTMKSHSGIVSEKLLQEWFSRPLIFSE